MHLACSSDRDHTTTATNSTTTIRIRLQTQPPLAPRKCWLPLRHSDADISTIAHLTRVVAIQLDLHRTAENNCPPALELTIDGFALMSTSSTFGVVRDNDLVTVGLCSHQLDSSSHLLGSQIGIVLNEKRKRHDDLSSDGGRLQKMSPFALGSLRSSKHGFSDDNKARSDRFKASNGGSKPSSEDEENYYITSSDETDHDQFADEDRIDRAIRKALDSSLACTNIKVAASDDSDTDSSNDTFPRIGQEPTDNAASESSSEESSSEESSSEEESSKEESSEEEGEDKESSSEESSEESEDKEPSLGQVPKETPSAKPACKAARVNPLDKSRASTQASETGFESAEQLATQSTAVRVPSGLTKSKRKAVQNMMDTERTHVRFDTNVSISSIPSATKDSGSTESTLTSIDMHNGDSATTQAKHSVETALKPEPRILYSVSCLNADNAPASQLSKSQKRRIRRNQRIAQLAIGGANIEDIKDMDTNGRVIYKVQSMNAASAQDLASEAIVDPVVGKEKNDHDDAKFNNDNKGEEGHTSVAPLDDSEDVNAFEDEVRNYQSMPYLKGYPQIGMTIAYKTLGMSAAYTPEISDYKEATVLFADPSTKRVSVKLAAHSLGLQAPMPSDPASMWGNPHSSDAQKGSGRFEIDDDSDGTQDGHGGQGNGVPNDDVVHIDLDDMFEIKHVLV
ncbi:hypothetical protein BASA61_001442 [Batrachochytrium salamandrivorans]|nr:hypothetical protein BASA61_001442 [Batrachochytrium salamandrivorans]KAH9273010.1 hypothetical protein BASA83_004575 [Batrachochytrium salamandrivorans]KAJ1340524.1 hypothetical protein BSLG_004618 [Batrachochytrium salamandrivorans]